METSDTQEKLDKVKLEDADGSAKDGQHQIAALAQEEEQNNDVSATEERNQAAQLIQRNYRGYRQRRELEGFGISPSARWIEAVKEAQYRNLIRPRARREWSSKDGPPERSSTTSSDARMFWRRATQVAKRAESDDTSDTAGEEGMTDAELQAYRDKKLAAKREREKNAKTMGLEYFLEMVDVKHRYGSHLRSYHEVWKQSDSNENFFYWLDYGDGREVVTAKCDRAKLEHDQVRYLSREERKYYLVKVDKDGKLRWAKNGELITTSDNVKDSLHGIVPEDDPTPSWRASHGKDDAASGMSYDTDSSHDLPAVSKDAKKTKRHKKKWIYTADTSFRLYIGFKQPGAFQHSSFLHGARIAAAGQIRIKNGQLRALQPLSGHYRPPTESFRAFVTSLRDEGVDLSRVSIPKAWAVLLGVQGFKREKARWKENVKKVKGVFAAGDEHGDVKRADTSQSAAREREVLAAEQARRVDGEKEKGAKGLVARILHKVHHGDESSK